MYQLATKIPGSAVESLLAAPTLCPDGSEKTIEYFDGRPVATIHRWETLKHLIRASDTYRVNSNALTVLRALVSCLTDHDGALVYANNATLSQRANGMPLKTLGNNLRALEAHGLLVRRMSPTRRRYVRRSSGVVIAGYGIDLSPFLERHDEFKDAARRADDFDSHVRAIRDWLSRSATALANENADALLVDEIRKERRRKPDVATLNDLVKRSEEALLPLETTIKMADDDSQIGRPRQEARTDKDKLNPQHKQTAESEITGRTFNAQRELESETGYSLPPKHRQTANLPRIELSPSSNRETNPSVPVTLRPSKRLTAVNREPHLSVELAGISPRDLATACPKVFSLLADQKLTGWDDLFRQAWKIGGWMGVGNQSLVEAQSRLGSVGMAITIFCICQRADHIQSPPAYLRSLCKKTDTGFSPFRLFQRLLNQNTPLTRSGC